MDNKDIDLTYKKSQEIAVAVKDKMAMAIKDLEEEIEDKNRKIRELVKRNEKLQAENISYAEITANIRDERRRNLADPDNNVSDAENRGYKGGERSHSG